MAKKTQLTWQAGAGDRPGRWRKKYRGHVYYFAAGRGKSDRQAYQAAVDAWLTRKHEIDREAPKRHAEDYQRAIAEWERVYAWSCEHGEQAMIDVAVQRLEKLRRDQSISRPQRLDFRDTFAAYFEADVRYPALTRSLAAFADDLLAKISVNRGANASATGATQTVATPNAQSDVSVAPSPPRNEVQQRLVVPHPEGFQTLQDSLTGESAVWRDRLQVRERERDLSGAETLGDLAKRFLGAKRQQSQAGDVSVSRAVILARHIDAFVEWLGAARAPAAIDGVRMLAYRDYLLSEVAAGTWARKTASTRLDSAKQFVRWLWISEAIEQLPRVMGTGSQELTVAAPADEVQPCGLAEIATLVTKASQRTRLYILLTLNTGMTQKDIADLQHCEVDFEEGRIRRKRSKTRKQSSVPVVDYKLWPETLALLKAEAAEPGSGLVLRNDRGGLLWTEFFGEDGRVKKNDNIRNAFERVRRKTGIKTTFKALKKQSASLLRGSKEYHGVLGLFLGHAPSSIAERNYAGTPQELLDEAVGWLREQYQAAGCLDEG